MVVIDVISPLISKKNPNFQVSVHECPKSFRRDLQLVFPKVIQSDKPLFAILTCQKAKYDLSGVNSLVGKEKDDLLESFDCWAKSICKSITEKGYWCDYIDPCSGLPMITKDTNRIYSEVDGMQALLRYDCYNAGMCKMLRHPAWGTSVYPASMFSQAPVDMLKHMIYSSLGYSEQADDRV